jgi:hypothetical protein
MQPHGMNVLLLVLLFSFQLFTVDSAEIRVPYAEPEGLVDVGKHEVIIKKLRFGEVLASGCFH